MIKSTIYEIIHDPVDSAIIIPGDIEDDDRPSTRMRRYSSFSDRPEVVTSDARKHRAWIDKEVIPLLLPLHRKTKYGILGIIAGHHWTQLSSAQNSVQYICQELTRLSDKKVRYLGEMMSYVRLRFIQQKKTEQESKTFEKLGLIVHGEGAGQTKASTIAKLEKLAAGFYADFIVRGHDCQLLSTKTVKLKPRSQRCKMGIPQMDSSVLAHLNLGAYTQGYNMDLEEPSYIERNLLRPATMGSGYLRFILRRAYEWEDTHHNIKCMIRVDI